MRRNFDNTPKGTLRRVHEINGHRFTPTQWAKLLEYYGANPEGDDGRLGENLTDQHVGRHVMGDGIAIMRFLSRYLQRGETPLDLVQDLARQAGFDVPECEVCDD
jgi:hypothetical protein